VIGDVFQYGERFRIGPMQILDDQDDRSAAADRGEQPQHALAQHHRRLDGSRMLRLVPLGNQAAQSSPIRS